MRRVPGAVSALEAPFSPAFQQALEALASGYRTGSFRHKNWGVTITRSSDARRLWLYGEELGGKDIVSFNLYRVSGDRFVVKPCEMSMSKVVEFVLGFQSPQ